MLLVVAVNGGAIMAGLIVMYATNCKLPVKVDNNYCMYIVYCRSTVAGFTVRQSLQCTRETATQFRFIQSSELF